VAAEGKAAANVEAMATVKAMVTMEALTTLGALAAVEAMDALPVGMGAMVMTNKYFLWRLWRGRTQSLVVSVSSRSPSVAARPFLIPTFRCWL
jgi:hypothetical protein